MADFALTYQDYLNARNEGDQSAFSESSSRNQPAAISEDQWNKLTPQQQLSEMAAQNGVGGSVITRDDPRYAGLVQATGQDRGGFGITFGPPPHAGDSNYYIDPSLIKPVGNGFYASPPNNLTAAAMKERHGLGVGD